MDSGNEKDGQEGSGKGYGDPYLLSSSDSFNTPLGSIIFKGDNYQNWSRSVRMALGAKNKLGFIDGSLKKPSIQNANYQRWVRNDNMVRCWLFASVSPKIADSMIYMSTDRQFWEELKERYGQTNAPLLYKLKKDLNELRQEGKSVTEFYCKMKNLWDEISAIEGVPECTCGAMASCTCNILKKLADADSLNKLIQFLMALSEMYDNMKSNILAMEPLPPVNRAFHLVQQQEKQKEVTGSMQNVPEMSALSVNRGKQQQHPKRESKEEKMKKKCEHCLMRGHLKEECFKLIGYPEWFKGKKGKGNKSGMNVSKQGQEVFTDSPLEKSAEAGESSGTKNEALVSAVVQEVLKAMGEKQGSVNFAGPLH